VQLRKSVVVGLQHEVLIDLRALGEEEAADLFHLGIFREKLLVLGFHPMLRVASHQELSQEDAWVKALSD
jgi:hypothetical protein